MASKTSNVVARVEPDVKEQAEEIMSQLGIPVSVVINMLYKQIILKKAIPFSLSLSPQIITLDSMEKDTLDSILKNGLEQAKNGDSLDAKAAFEVLGRELANE